MNRADTLSPLIDHNDNAANDDTPSVSGNNLREAVTTSVRDYLAQLDGQISTDVYQMVLAEIEAPLLEEPHEENEREQQAEICGRHRVDSHADGRRQEEQRNQVRQLDARRQ